MNRLPRSLVFTAVLGVGLFDAGSAFATNGMDLEGYGPIATGMGGASMAYDNGTAAIMNNPATLGLAPQGTRLDVALGILGPSIEASIPGAPPAKSSANAFFMPAVGLIRKSGQLAYGFGVFAQGGMGTEYGKSSWLADPSQGANTALTQGLINRSEVSVGRFILPLAMDLSPRLKIATSLDFVWASMDLQMAMSQAQFVDLVTTQQAGTASGSFVQAFGSLYEPFGGTGVQTLYDAYFDFSNNNAFIGDATGTGFAGKVGAVFKINDRWSVGGSYHSRTGLNDLKSTDAMLDIGVKIDTGIAQGQAPSGVYQDMNIPVSGKISVNNFQWPATYAFGAAFKATDKLLVVGDIKRIKWADVMKDFSMTFDADNVAANGGFAGLSLDATLFQDWKDQTVYEIGFAYQVLEPLTLRLGYNYGANPIPDKFVNPLFPAIEQGHVTMGAGYAVTQNGAINFSLTVAPEVKVTNPGNPPAVPAVTITHSQLNGQLMYTQLF